MQRLVVIGAYSAIAEATAREYTRRGAAFFLVGRDLQRLEAIAEDLRVRGAASVAVWVLDVNDFDQHAPMLDAAQAALGGIDIALIAHGTLPVQDQNSESFDTALHEFSTNGTSTIALGMRIASQLQRGSTLAVISSVAGDRGRASNYLYGSAKAAVTAFFLGIGQQLHSEGINVLVVKPGFVVTPMTAAFKKGALWVSPQKIAFGIVRAIDKRKAIAYLPWFWWGIMQIIKNIPERIFRRIRL